MLAELDAKTMPSDMIRKVGLEVMKIKHQIDSIKIRSVIYGCYKLFPLIYDQIIINKSGLNELKQSINLRNSGSTVIYLPQKSVFDNLIITYLLF